MDIVTYTRVSTSQQGHSGLGLEAQQASIDAFVKSRGATVLGTFTEIESGKVDARPQLEKAMRLAEERGATLLIAKLDRLSRDGAFLYNFRKSSVKFEVADMPGMNSLTLSVMIGMAQYEREIISERTRAALQAAKAKGKVLGNPNGAAALKRAGKGNAAGVAAIKKKADEFAARILHVVDELAENGIVSNEAIARALNERKTVTARGGKWHGATVRNLRARIASAA